MTAWDTIEIKLPRSCKTLVLQDACEPHIWTITCVVEAIDVETGLVGEFKTKWTGNKPTKEDIFKTIMIMLRHEVAEQLGLDPHHKNIPREDEP